jgi:hypothetical protein
MNLNYNNNNLFSNCALFGNIGFYNLMFQNCLSTRGIPTQNNAGGNIQISQQQLGEIYTNYIGHDYHLNPGSIAIDAGILTSGLDYSFDLDYRQRIWDGIGNGNAVIDIGPYEYGAPEFGTLECYTFSEINYQAVDYVFIEVDENQEDFALTDGSGYAAIKLPAGIYELQAQRMFYDNTTIEQIEIFQGQTTQIFIPMEETVEIEENTICNQISKNMITNYPNPFNPSTEIRFQISDLNDLESAKLTVYNLKGQKVKTLDCSNSFVAYTRDSCSTYSVTWNGTDDRGKSVSSGIYFAKLKVEDVEASCKMMLLK